LEWKPVCFRRQSGWQKTKAILKVTGMIIKSRKSVLILPLLIGMVLLSSTFVACASQSKPVEPSGVSPAQQPAPSSSDDTIPQNVAAENIVRLANGEWPPYCSEELEHYGIGSRILTEAFALEGIEVEYGFFPWIRAYELAKTGEWDGSVPWLKTPEREIHFYYSDPIINCDFVFWHLKGFDFDWDTIEDLHGVTIGATRGYFYEEMFTKLEETGQVSIEWVSSDVSNFEKLLNGRIDLYVQDMQVGVSMLQKNFTPEGIQLLTYHPNPLRVDPLCLILSRKVVENERLITLLNRGLQRLRESGKIEMYLAEAIGDEQGKE